MLSINRIKPAIRLFKREYHRLRRLGLARYRQVYVAVALGILAGTTVFWSLLGALIHAGNADQLVGPALFAHGVFRAATFPSAHTFLLKWPIFWFLARAGSSIAWETVLTVLISLASVGAFAYILWRIERRPLVFGTLVLALASALLLTPVTPYAGALLPVNMAMLTTRNIEYIVYLGSLFLLLKSRGYKDYFFGGGVVGLAILFASDKLFLSMSLLASGLALVFYSAIKRWRIVGLAAEWFVGSLCAAVLATLLLWSINSTHLTHLTAQSSLTYSGVRSAHNLGLGIIYGVMNVLTNLGANPAFNATLLRQIPGHFFGGIFNFGGLGYLLNLAILSVGLLGGFKIWKASQRHVNQLDGLPFRFSLTLIWSCMAAFILFALSDHYYAVDARYLSILLFTVLVVAAFWTSQRRWQPQTLAAASILLVIGMALGSVAVYRNYVKDQNALADINNRNKIVAQVLAKHPVDTLVADYWRAIPIQAGNKGVQVMPLANCTTARVALSSQAWQPNLEKHSFAYLLSLDKNLTDYPNCSLDQVIKYYGRPNSSVVVAGHLSQPKEYLLFYDHGIHQLQTASPVTTVTPIDLADLPHTYCSVPTTMNIVAHQDDDLLFMNPDLLHKIKAGHCVRTIYVTAGNAGGGSFYWLSREQGSEAAYSQMTGLPNVWVSRSVKLKDGQYITVVNPPGANNVSLIFMHLPDGNIKGNGFPAFGFESLAKLGSGAIKTITAVDGESQYTADQLVASIDSLMHAYQPAEINTQSDYNNQQFPDHSDHLSVGLFVKKAYGLYEAEQYNNQVHIPINYYIGYPVHALPVNLFGQDQTDKKNTWFAYAAYDGGVCHTPIQCKYDPFYSYFLTRQYQNAN